MAQDDRDRAYYERQRGSTLEFWRRFGSRPEVAGRRILDVGSGHGALSIDLAEAGGIVVGVDTDGPRIEWAKRNLTENHSDLGSRVTFLAQEVAQLPREPGFDLVVSKDTFEHVADVAALLVDLRARLHESGQVWAGFSPLYSSPRGDHGRAGLHIPWAHAVLPRSVVYRAASRQHRNGRPVRNLSDIGLNGLTPADFRRAAAEAGFAIDSVSYNRGHGVLLDVVSAARRIPALERFMTVSMYLTLVPAVAGRPT